MRIAFVGGAVGALALMFGVQAAVAGGTGAVQVDPKASSPAGVIYQIPLDNGRRSAAPVLPVGSRASVGTPGDPSSIHSENGFGSSSHVPGVAPAALRAGVVPAAHTSGSALPTFLLMGLVAAAAIAAGVIATGARRRRAAGPPEPPMDT
jgi:hypothetical protein